MDSIPRATASTEPSAPALSALGPESASEGDLHSLLTDVAHRLDGRKPGLTMSLKFDLSPEGIYRFLIVDRAVTLAEGDGKASAWVTMKAA